MFLQVPVGIKFGNFLAIPEDKKCRLSHIEEGTPNLKIGTSNLFLSFPIFVATIKK